MKHCSVIFVLIVMFVFPSCKKDSSAPDPVKPPNGPWVVAGNSAGLFSPQFESFTLNVPANNSSAYKDLDVNNDGIMDYCLKVTCPFQDHSLESWLGIISYDLNEVAVTYSQPTWIKSFHASDSINNKQSWYGCNVLFYEAPQETGYWVNVTNRYVGIRTHTGDKVLYGWIAVDVVKPDKLVIRGYASQQ